MTLAQLLLERAQKWGFVVKGSEIEFPPQGEQGSRARSNGFWLLPEEERGKAILGVKSYTFYHQGPRKIFPLTWRERLRKRFGFVVTPRTAAGDIVRVEMGSAEFFIPQGAQETIEVQVDREQSDKLRTLEGLTIQTILLPLKRPYRFSLLRSQIVSITLDVLRDEVEFA